MFFTMLLRWNQYIHAYEMSAVSKTIFKDYPIMNPDFKPAVFILRLFATKAALSLLFQKTEVMKFL